MNPLPDRVEGWFLHLAVLHVRRVWLRADVYNFIVALAGGLPLGHVITICGVEVRERLLVTRARHAESFHVRFTSHERVW